MVEQGLAIAEQKETYLRTKLRRIWRNQTLMRLIGRHFLTLEETEPVLTESRNMPNDSIQITYTQRIRLVCHPKWLSRIFLKTGMRRGLVTLKA